MTEITKLGSRNGNSLYIKREDLLPVSFGGNKARKAEYFFREIDKGGYDWVVTYGSSSSNHCRIAANLAAARNLPCTIIGPEEASEPTFNSQMMELFGAERIVVPVTQVHDTIETTLEDLRSQRKKPYFIPGGGHGNLGTQAYVDCWQEIRAYEKQQGVKFDYVFFASGTGTTQAGLVCGRLMDSADTNIIGISIARKTPRGRQVVLDSIQEYLDAKNITVSPETVENATVFVDDFTGDGYGKDSLEIDRTIEGALREYGVPMDPTYTGKAFFGMEQYLEREQITGKNVLFLHTGGTPLFFDWLQKRRSK